MRRLAFEATLGCQAPISASIVHELNVREERWKKVTWGKIIVDRITARFCRRVTVGDDHVTGVLNGIVFNRD